LQTNNQTNKQTNWQTIIQGSRYIIIHPSSRQTDSNQLGISAIEDQPQESKPKASALFQVSKPKIRTWWTCKSGRGTYRTVNSLQASPEPGTQGLLAAFVYLFVQSTLLRCCKCESLSITKDDGKNRNQVRSAKRPKTVRIYYLKLFHYGMPKLLFIQVCSLAWTWASK